MKSLQRLTFYHHISLLFVFYSDFNIVMFAQIPVLEHVEECHFPIQTYQTFFVLCCFCSNGCSTFLSCPLKENNICGLWEKEWHFQNLKPLKSSFWRCLLCVLLNCESDSFFLWWEQNAVQLDKLGISTLQKFICLCAEDLETA